MDEIGCCRVLGYPYQELKPRLMEIYNVPWSEQRDGMVAAVREMADYVLSRCEGEFYVIRGSKWILLLNDAVSAGRVQVCEIFDVGQILLKKKHFVFVDNDEFTEGVVQDLLVTFSAETPPGLLTFGQLAALSEHFVYISGITEVIDTTAARINKQFLYVAGFDRDSSIMGDSLYLLCSRVTAVMKQRSHRLGTLIIGSSPIVGSRYLFPKYLDHKEYAYLIWNIPDKNARIDSSIFNIQCDHCFIHGEQRIQLNSCVYYPPCLFYSMFPERNDWMRKTIDSVLPVLGMRQPTSILSIWRKTKNEQRCKISMQPVDSLRITKEEAILMTYSLLSPFSYLTFDSFNIDLSRIVENTDCMLTIFIRDLRDVIVAGMNYENHVLIRYGGADGKSFLKDFIEKHLSVLCRNLMKVKDHPRVLFLKYEDMFNDPADALNTFIDRMPFANDPFRLRNCFSEFITQTTEQCRNELGNGANDHAKDIRRREDFGYRHQCYTTPGVWQDFFDDELKNWFKSNDHGFLKFFAYEMDDNW